MSMMSMSAVPHVRRSQWPGLEMEEDRLRCVEHMEENVMVSRTTRRK